MGPGRQTASVQSGCGSWLPVSGQRGGRETFVLWGALPEARLSVSGVSGVWADPSGRIRYLPRSSDFDDVASGVRVSGRW